MYLGLDSSLRLEECALNLNYSVCIIRHSYIYTYSMCVHGIAESVIWPAIRPLSTICFCKTSRESSQSRYTDSDRLRIVTVLSFLKAPIIRNNSDDFESVGLCKEKSIILFDLYSKTSRPRYTIQAEYDIIREKLFGGLIIISRNTWKFWDHMSMYLWWYVDRKIKFKII